MLIGGIKIVTLKPGGEHHRHAPSGERVRHRIDLPAVQGQVEKRCVDQVVAGAEEREGLCNCADRAEHAGARILEHRGDRLRDRLFVLYEKYVAAEQFALHWRAHLARGAVR